MRVRDYTSAVTELIREGLGEELVLTNLKRMLTTRGHLRLYPQILRTLEREAIRNEAHDTVTVTLAKASDGEALKSHINEAIRSLEGTAHTITIDPTITGGFIAATGEKRVDASYKKQLLTLYRSLTKPSTTV
jgi:F0F1-type ATP synthase delta subunit